MDDGSTTDRVVPNHVLSLNATSRNEIPWIDVILDLMNDHDVAHTVMTNKNTASGALQCHAVCFDITSQPVLHHDMRISKNASPCLYACITSLDNE